MPVYHVGHVEPLELGILIELAVVEVARNVYPPTLKLVEELLRSDGIRTGHPLALEVFKEGLAIKVGGHAPPAIPEFVKEPLGVEGLGGRCTCRHEKASHADCDEPASNPLHGTLPVFVCATRERHRAWQFPFVQGGQ